MERDESSEPTREEIIQRWRERKEQEAGDVGNDGGSRWDRISGFKKILGVVVPVAIVVAVILVTQLGKDKPTAPTNYVDRSVGGLTAAVPVDWIEDEEVSAEIEQEASQLGQIIEARLFSDVSDSVALALLVYDVKETYESQGFSWGGWQQVEELEGMSKRAVSIMYSSGFMVELENVTREDTTEVTVGDKDAYEIYCTGEVELIPADVKFLCIFGEDDLGIIVLICKEIASSTFQECWPEIRDSANLQ